MNFHQANKSYWEKEAFPEKAQFVIVGAGIVGLNTAINLLEWNANLDVTIIDRGFLPIGASTRNAGFACFGSPSELLADSQTQSEEDVFLLVEKRYKGLKSLLQRVPPHEMDYQSCGGYELFDDRNEEMYEQCKERLAQFNKLLRPIVGKEAFQIADQEIKNLQLKNTNHLIFNPYEGKLQPAKMLRYLLRKAQSLGAFFLWGQEVKRFERSANEVQLEITNGVVKCEQLILATNAFSKTIAPKLDIKAARNQVFISKPISNLKIHSTFHYNEGYLYFSNVGDRLLIGGARNLDLENEETSLFGITEKIKEAIITFSTEKNLCNGPFEIDMEWSGMIGIGDQKDPIVRSIEPNVFAAVRLGGMGVAIGTIVAEDLVNIIINK